MTALTPEQTFVKTLFTHLSQCCRYRGSYWAHMHERVEDDGQHLRIVDAHQVQPGAVLFDLWREDDGWHVKYQYITYPFFKTDWDDCTWDVVLTAVTRLRRATARRSS